MPAPPSILVYGSDTLLLKTRSLVLEKEGFRVFHTMEVERAQAVVEGHEVTLVVLCHTLSAEARESFLRYADRRDPVLKTLVLTSGAPHPTGITSRMLLSAFDGPRRLIETVNQLLESSQIAS